jgi:hypothetical protein
MFSIRRLITILILTVLSFTVFSQHDISKYKLENITDPVLPLITNRIIDTLANNWMVLKNEIDHRNSLKVFMVEAGNDSVYCEKSGYRSLSDLFSQPGNDWVLLIHGDSKAPVDAAVRGLEVQNLHGVKVLVFSWPSKMSTNNGLKNYRNSRTNVEAGLAHFRELLLTVQKYRNSYIWPEGNNLSLFMHSLGNYYLELSVKEDMLQGLDPALFDNIIINAAAIEQQDHAGWVKRIEISDRIYIISNEKDFNLRGARLFTKAGKQLGGPVEFPLARNAIYINFTEAVGFKVPTWVSHTYFVGEMPRRSNNIRNFYTTIFHGLEVDLDDTELLIERSDGLGYDIRE